MSKYCYSKLSYLIIAALIALFCVSSCVCFADRFGGISLVPVETKSHRPTGAAKNNDKTATDNNSSSSNTNTSGNTSTSSNTSSSSSTKPTPTPSAPSAPAAPAAPKPAPVAQPASPSYHPAEPSKPERKPDPTPVVQPSSPRPTPTPTVQPATRSESETSRNYRPGKEQSKPDRKPDSTPAVQSTPQQPAPIHVTQPVYKPQPAPVAQSVTQTKPEPVRPSVKEPVKPPAANVQNSSNNSGQNNYHPSSGSVSVKKPVKPVKSTSKSSYKPVSKNGKKNNSKKNSNSVSVKPGVTYHPSKPKPNTPSKPVNPGTTSPVTYKPAPKSYKPVHYGYYAKSYQPRESRRSCYYNYGMDYVYLEEARVIVETYPQVVYLNNASSSSDYNAEQSRQENINEALTDIRAAFLAGRYDLIEKHVRKSDTIAVLLDGQYDYSISGEDYLDMTYDALESLLTAGFIWENVKDRSDGTVTAFASHSYYHGTSIEKADTVKNVYASFTLRQVGTEYYIVEVGSSSVKPI